jgi:hypothetical protein
MTFRLRAMSPFCMMIGAGVLLGAGIIAAAWWLPR